MREGVRDWPITGFRISGWWLIRFFFFSHTSHLLLCSPTDGAARIYLFNLLIIEHARAPFQRVWVQLIPNFYTREGEKPFWIDATGFEPRPPAWEASALSITPLPLGLDVIRSIEWWLWIWSEVFSCGSIGYGLAGWPLKRYWLLSIWVVENFLENIWPTQRVIKLVRSTTMWKLY